MEYKTLAPLVALDALSAPMPRVLHALAQAGRDFFRLSRTWTITAPPTPLWAGQKTYALPIPDGADLCGVTEVRYAGRKLDPVTPDQLSGDWEAMRGFPGAYTMAVPVEPMQDYVDPRYFLDPLDYIAPEPDEFAVDGEYKAIRLVPFPSEENGSMLRVRFTVAPTLTATGVPDSLGNRYQDALIAGAKAGLLSDAGKPWSDPRTAAIFAGEFQRLLNDARQEARRGAVNSRQQVRLRRL